MAGLKSVTDLIKEGIVVYGNDPSLKVTRLPIGIAALDAMLGGGLPLGRCLISFGPESTGKTLIAQWCAKAVQASEHPIVLYMDMERSYDKEWWDQSGVDTEKLLVSSPATAEQALDIMRAMLTGEPALGMIILDSIAAMTPAPEIDPDKSSEDKTIGLQARVVTLMYHQIVPLLDNRVIFYACNQMRETIGYAEELTSLPGGRAQRHYSHIILRTKRDSWIKKDKDNIGFYMEITQKKNKLASTPDGSFVLLPFMFTGQIDMLTALIEEAIRQKRITRSGPYYKWKDKSYLGIPNLRNFFLENNTEQEELNMDLAVV